MKKIYALLFCMMGFITTQAQASHVVISEVYGGGGNTSAPYRNDFIEIYNPTSSAVNLSGWSVQYASATGTSWAVTPLTSFSLLPGQYYLIAEASGGAIGAALPTADATGTINLSATAGKVILCNTITPQTIASPTGLNIIDKIGFGSTANGFEGTAPSPPGSNTASIERKASSISTALTLAAGGSEATAGNGYDMDQNSTDFVAQTGISPQNTLNFETPTSGPSILLAATKNAAEPSTNGSFTITLSPATTASTTIDFAFTGTATYGTDYTVSYSAGTTPSTTSTGTLTVPAGTSSVTVTITPIDDALVEGTETITLALSNPTASYTLGTASASINLTDDDIAPTVSIAAGTNAGEPSTIGNFTLNFSTATTASTSVNFAFAGTATFGTDYAVTYSTGTTPSTTSTGTLTVPAGTSSVTVTVTPIDDALVEGTETISLTLSSPTAGYTLGTASATINITDDDVAAPTAYNVVINQIYGGGGNSGSIYKNDFIELYNNENTAVNLAGWSIQFTSAGGTTWNVGALTGTIPAHSYYLIQESAGSAGTTSLPTADATGTFAIGAGSGLKGIIIQCLWKKEKQDNC